MRKPPMQRDQIPSLCAAALVAALLSAASAAQAEIDGHGPDAWRVTGVAENDRLNARMGPGTSYRVIGTFAADARGLLQVTCVPYLTAGIYGALSEAERQALPPRWCLMRSPDLTKAGWVAQRFLAPDEGPEGVAPAAAPNAAPASGADAAEDPAEEARLQQAEALVQALYAALERAERGKAADPLTSAEAAAYFSGEFRRHLNAAEALPGHPLYGAQDFEGALTLIARHPERAVVGDSVVVVADFVNFGAPQQAVFTLAADPSQPGQPLRIAHIAHAGWSLPEE